MTRSVAGQANSCGASKWFSRWSPALLAHICAAVPRCAGRWLNAEKSELVRQWTGDGPRANGAMSMRGERRGTELALHSDPKAPGAVRCLPQQPGGIAGVHGGRVDAQCARDDAAAGKTKAAKGVAGYRQQHARGRGWRRRTSMGRVRYPCTELLDAPLGDEHVHVSSKMKPERRVASAHGRPAFGAFGKPQRGRTLGPGATGRGHVKLDVARIDAG